MSLTEFMALHDTEEKCVAHLAEARWADGPVCDKCCAVNNASGAAGRAWIITAISICAL